MEASDTFSTPSTRPSSVDNIKLVANDAVASQTWKELDSRYPAQAKIDPAANHVSRSLGPDGICSANTSQDKDCTNRVLQPMKLSKILDDLMELKLFLETAPVHFSPHDVIRRFRLHTEEEISCVRWNNVYYMTGTDIVRCLTYRFAAFGRTITNRKKFEEGIFSDLRNLKCNEHAKLEGAKSEFLGFLYKHNCIRTKKKQKVFHWFSVRHDQLFIDALERDLKKESCAYRHTSEQSATQAVSEPALSFKYDHKQTLHDQIGGAITDLPSPLAQIVNATMTSTVLGIDGKGSSTDGGQAALDSALLNGSAKSANVTVVQVAPGSALTTGDAVDDPTRVILLDSNQVPVMALPPGASSSQTPDEYPQPSVHAAAPHIDGSFGKPTHRPAAYDDPRGIKRELGDPVMFGHDTPAAKYSRVGDINGRMPAQSEDTPYRAMLTLLSIGSNPTRNVRSIIAAQNAVKVLTRAFPNFRPGLGGESLGMVLMRIQGLYLSEEEMSYVEEALRLAVSTRDPPLQTMAARSAVPQNPYVVPMAPFIDNDLFPELPLEAHEPLGYSHVKDEEPLPMGVHRHGFEPAPVPGEYAGEYGYDAPAPLLKEDGYDLPLEHTPAYASYHQPRYRYPSAGYAQYGNGGPYRQPAPAQTYYEDYAPAEAEHDSWGASGRAWYGGYKPAPRAHSRRTPSYPTPRRDDAWP